MVFDHFVFGVVYHLTTRKYEMNFYNHADAKSGVEQYRETAISAMCT